MFQQRRPEVWEDRTTTVSQVRELIATLDPVEDCAEITHLSLEVVVPPMLAHASYASGFARGITHPAEAIVAYRGGGYLNAPDDRDRDTLAFFGLLHRYGLKRPETQAIVDRIQQIHHDVKGVGNDLQLHILGLLIYEPERWARDLGAPKFFTQIENEARYHLWAGLGQMMGLKGIWGSYAEVEPWVLEFEARHSVRTKEGDALYAGQIRGFERWFPGPAKRLAGQFLTAGLPRSARPYVGGPAVRPGVELIWKALVKAELLTRWVRPVNLSSSWVSDFSRLGDDPDIHEMGHQHDRAADPRYQRAGDSADGYRFTVARGLESARGCPVHGGSPTREN